MAEDTITRTFEVPFALTRDAGEGDGLTFEGYAAVFNRVEHIEDEFGVYDEVIAPGAFAKTIRERMPQFMFNHGKSPLWHNMPIGRITELREDPRGLYVRARLSDNWLIHPIRDAIRDGAIEGMSVRAEYTKQDRKGTGRQQLRTVREAKVFELGPVTFPAYTETTAAVRSLEQVEPAIRILVADPNGYEREQVPDTPDEAVPEEPDTSEEAVTDDEPTPEEARHSSFAERQQLARRIQTRHMGLKGH